MKRQQIRQGSFYHFYNRGVDKRIVFSEPSDYKRFQAYLYLLNTQEKIRPSDILSAHGDEKIFSLARGNPLVAIGAYCLMPNHFHGYATPLVENGLSKFMQRVQTAYTMYFNQKRKRSGALFQGVFRTQPMDDEADARQLVAFIHLSPIALVDPAWAELNAAELARFKKEIREYPYSSIGEYIAGEPVITDISKFPKYFQSRRHVDDHLSMWLRAKEAHKGK